MPPPFGQIIRNGIDGTWTLQDMRAALGGLFDAKPPGDRRSVATPPKPVNAALTTPAVAEEKAPSAATKPIFQTSGRAEAQPPLPLLNEDRNAASARATTGKSPWGRKDALGEAQSFSLRSTWLGAAGIVAVVLLLSTWLLAHAWNAHARKALRDGDAVSQQGAQSAKQTTKPISGSAAPRSVATNLPRGNSAALAGSRADWRVIPFTYNRRTDAEKKVSDIAHSHPQLQPLVFTPSGHAPYMVSIGGVMDRDAAYALARRARSLGLPHDTYAQNFRQ
jgi:hypothetical protein